MDDLGSWKYEGISYPYTATTASLEEGGNLAAPDCVQGPDGRYYLYYNRGKYDPCEVAVSDTPQGPFTYLCNVTFPNGTIPATKMFDPGVLVDDDGRIYLYIGFCPTSDFPWALKLGKYSLGFELEPDMHTIKAGPFEVLPGCQATAGTGFEGHGFYEASSPRKIGKRYYLVYSSEQSHDLCYAVSDQPLTGYRYGGVLVSNADIGRNGNTTPKAPYGNTHGGLVQLGGQWYIFYHRQTHGIECCRQAVPNPLCWMRKPFSPGRDHKLRLNGGPLPGIGSYNACYACNLTHETIGKERLTIRKCVRDTQPHIFEEPASSGKREDSLHYIANMQDGTLAGSSTSHWGMLPGSPCACGPAHRAAWPSIWTRPAPGKPLRSPSPPARTGREVQGSFSAPAGTLPLFFRLNCTGRVDWESFILT